MKRLFLLLVMSILLLAGCSSKKEEPSELLPSLDPIAVELSVSPEKIEINTLVNITAIVTQADEKVDDASEVVFEIWKKGDEEHMMQDAINQGDGRYVVEKSFDQNGMYTVISHVTARNMHSMPKKEFIVGNGDTTVTEELQEEATQSNEADQSGHHAHSAIEIGFQAADVIEVEKETVLTATVNIDHHTPFSEADVQFEIWQDGDEKHYYIVAKELNGSYQAATTFSNQGNYNVRIHVRKGDLHDHMEKIIEVK